MALSVGEAGNSIGLTSPDQDCTPVAFCYPSLRLARVTPGTALSVHLVYIFTELSYPARKMDVPTPPCTFRTSVA